VSGAPVQLGRRAVVFGNVGIDAYDRTRFLEEGAATDREGMALIEHRFPADIVHDSCKASAPFPGERAFVL
jgi:hypothetical protein